MSETEPKEFDAVGDHAMWVYDVGYGNRHVNASRSSDHLYIVSQKSGALTFAGIVDGERIPRIRLSKKVVMALVGSVLRKYVAELLGLVKGNTP